MDSGHYSWIPTTFGKGQIYGFRKSNIAVFLKAACIRENSTFLFLINMRVEGYTLGPLSTTSAKKSWQSVTILRNSSVTQLICLFVGMCAFFSFCNSFRILSGCHVHFCYIPLTVWGCCQPHLWSETCTLRAQWLKCTTERGKEVVPGSCYKKILLSEYEQNLRNTGIILNRGSNDFVKKVCLGCAEHFQICFELEETGSLSKNKSGILVKKVNKCIFALPMILIYLKDMFTKESGTVVEKRESLGKKRKSCC